jgi:hypothetical protein
MAAVIGCDSGNLVAPSPISAAETTTRAEPSTLTDAPITVRGLVTDVGERPITGAEICVGHPDGSPMGQPLAVTGVEGSFEVTVPATSALVVRKPGYGAFFQGRPIGAFRQPVHVWMHAVAVAGETLDGVVLPRPGCEDSRALSYACTYLEIEVPRPGRLELALAWAPPDTRLVLQVYDDDSFVTPRAESRGTSPLRVTTDVDGGHHWVEVVPEQSGSAGRQAFRLETSLTPR